MFSVYRIFAAQFLGNARKELHRSRPPKRYSADT